jgi:uncharacterized membrane protein YfcA
VILFGIGAAGGFAAGLLGIGGGIIMVPLLAYVAGLPFHMATSISIVQVFVAALSGVYRHYRLGSVSPRVGLLMGLASAATAAVASAMAPAVPALYLQGAFFILLAASAVLLMLPKREPAPGAAPKPGNLPVVALGLGAGAVTGTLGAGGGFFMVPVMIYGLNLGTRMAIGTSLSAILLGSLSGTLTKIATGQIDMAVAVFVVAGGFLGAQLGAIYSHRLSTKTLRILLFFLLAIIALRTLAGIIGLVA